MTNLVSIDIAKLLKEKRFDKPCLICYLENGDVQISSGDDGDLDEYNHNEWDNYSAPTISETVMWLYDKHGIWISVGCYCYGGLWYASLHVASEKNWNNLDLRYQIESATKKFDEHKHPKEAYEEAIEYCLTNLL